MNSLDRVNDRYFYGIEVEGTPFKGQRTLFVATCPTEFLGSSHAFKHLIQRTHVAYRAVEHVYLGANQYYQRQPSELIDLVAIVSSAHALVYAGFNVTLDLPTSVWNTHASALFDESSKPKSLVQQVLIHKRFCLLLSEAVRFADKVANLAVKIDDNQGVGGPNGGVWVAQKSNCDFTPWSAYSDDKAVS